MDKLKETGLQPADITALVQLRSEVQLSLAPTRPLLTW